MLIPGGGTHIYVQYMSMYVLWPSPETPFFEFGKDNK